ncbi:hypothetical protein MSPP1_002979 [Malassezia sp. CBS 17886]|nr:hypothetical protein MSPP1_002979 [Malassezia sp. CBS 17886]
MSNTVVKVNYKPDPMATDEYSVIINPDEYEKWRNGDRTIPLADVVDLFNIFHTDQGNQGLLRRASKQQLEAVFGTQNEDEAIEKLLQIGYVQPGQLKGHTQEGRFPGTNK